MKPTSLSLSLSLSLPINTIEFRWSWLLIATNHLRIWNYLNSSNLTNRQTRNYRRLTSGIDTVPVFLVLSDASYYQEINIKEIQHKCRISFIFFFFCFFFRTRDKHIYLNVRVIAHLRISWWSRRNCLRSRPLSRRPTGSVYIYHSHIEIALKGKACLKQNKGGEKWNAAALRKSVFREACKPKKKTNQKENRVTEWKKKKNERKKIRNTWCSVL